MKELVHHSITGLIGALLLTSSIDASAITAAVTVTATRTGTISSTRIGRLSVSGGCAVSCGSADYCATGLPASRGTQCAVLGGNVNTWSSGAFTVAAGTNTYHLNILSSTTAGSLDQLLCGNGGLTKGCNVTICANSSQTFTATSNGNCTISGGAIIPTCSGTHVVSVTSNLTLSCP